MSFSLGGLTAYVQQNVNDIVPKLVTKPKTLNHISIMTEVLNQKLMPNIDTDAIFQAGNNCNWNASGTTTIEQRTMTVATIAVMESICNDTLVGYFTEQALRAKSSVNLNSQEAIEQFLFEAWTNQKMARIASQIENAIWQGDTASGSASLNKFDGFIKIIDAASDEINGNPTGITTATGITKANILDILDGMNNLVPDRVKTSGKEVLYIMGVDTFGVLTQAARDKNWFAGFGLNVEQMEVQIMGILGKIVAVPGLTGTNRIFATYRENLVFGTYGEAEEPTERKLLTGNGDVFMVYPDEDMLGIKFRAKFRAGVNYRYSNEIVSFKLV